MKKKIQLGQPYAIWTFTCFISGKGIGKSLNTTVLKFNLAKLRKHLLDKEPYSASIYIHVRSS